MATADQQPISLKCTRERYYNALDSGVIRDDDKVELSMPADSRFGEFDKTPIKDTEKAMQRLKAVGISELALRAVSSNPVAPTIFLASKAGEWLHKLSF